MEQVWWLLDWSLGLCGPFWGWVLPEWARDWGEPKIEVKHKGQFSLLSFTHMEGIFFSTVLSRVGGGVMVGIWNCPSYTHQCFSYFNGLPRYYNLSSGFVGVVKVFLHVESCSNWYFWEATNARMSYSGISLISLSPLGFWWGYQT